MTLSAGTSLGAFEISGLLGVGGMGEVYRAKDTKLGREVAIKVLPEVFAEDKDRLARFEREAKLLASLDHPNIAVIHELQEAEGVRFLVMQLVEGQTLADRIAAGAIPIEEALPVFAQIAEALESAHEHGIIHRDLKPANIKVTDDGRVKVLDFGLAKVVEGAEESMDPSDAPTIGSDLTTRHTILGTPAYMSPEQARGQKVDKRTDIWAFGCCLYESLAGRRPFRGETTSDVLAKVLETEPDWQALPKQTPARVRVLLWRCLHKNPQRRLRDIGEARFEISETSSDPSGGIPSLGATTETSGVSRSRHMAGMVATLVLGLVVASVAVWKLQPSEAEVQPIVRFQIALPEGEQLYTRRAQVAISPDGSKVAFVAVQGSNTHIILRSLNRWTTTRITVADGSREPFFSPDGEWLGFWAGDRIWKVRLEGGTPIPICDATGWAGATWGPDDIIYFCPAWNSGLWKVSSDGSGLEMVTTPDRAAGEYGHWFPQVTPDGETVLFTTWRISLNDISVDAYSVKTGQRKILVVGGSYGRVTSSGHLVYAQGDSLFAARFDPERLEVGRDHRRVLVGLEQHAFSGAASYAISRTGTLLYAAGRGVWGNQREIVWMDREGNEEAVAGLEPGSYSSVQLSPDQRRLAITLFEGGRDRIAIYDLESRRLTKIALEAVNFAPLWRPPGGEWLAFTTSSGSGAFSIHWMPLDESSPPGPLYVADHDVEAVNWSPDGQHLIVLDGIADLRLLPVEDPEAPIDLEAAPAVFEMKASFSPLGDWLAFDSDEEGRREVYARPMADRGRPTKISKGGGHSPLWSAEGDEIFYHDGESLMAVAIKIEGERLNAGAPQELFRGRFGSYPRLHATYDYDAESQRFLLIKAGGEEVSATHLNVVLNWVWEIESAAFKTEVPSD